MSRLEVAWEFHTGDPGEMQTNPLIVDGVLYGLSAAGSVFALDAATGGLKWRHTPPGAKTNRILRGLARWVGGGEQRLFFTVGEWLHALDARSGEAIASFGEEGRVNLHAGLGERSRAKWVISTTPGTIFEDLIVMPIRVGEAPDAAPGAIQAFNVRSGELVWTFHTIPRPGEPGYETWSENAYHNINVGGANSWAGSSLDEKRGLLFIAATKDARLRAFDCSTGECLWETRLPAAGFATPGVCAVDGRQYIVVAAGGKKLGTPEGDSYIAYALPQRSP